MGEDYDEHSRKKEVRKEMSETIYKEEKFFFCSFSTIFVHMSMQGVESF